MRTLDRREIQDYIREHRALFDVAGASNPFVGSEWLLPFIEHVAQDDWRFIVPEYGSRSKSVMLLYSRMSDPHRYLPVTNYYASLYTPLISHTRPRSASFHALAEQITTALPECISINCAPLDGEAPGTLELERAFAAHGWHTKRYACFGNWYLPCAGLSFDRYLRERDMSLRMALERKERRFRLGEDGARLTILTSPNEVAAGMAAYERIHARGWNRTEPYPGFVHDWAHVCAAHGWLRLGLAYVHDTPIAAQFWFTRQRRAYIFKLAYDESYARFSASTVLSAHMMRHSLERDRVREIDYLTGDDAYKRAWMPRRRERIGLMLCNPRTMRGQLLSTHQLASEARQRWLRATRPTPGLPALPAATTKPLASGQTTRHNAPRPDRRPALRT